MAALGESTVRSHRSASRGGSPRLKADLKLLEPPLSRRRSAQSVSGASQSDEQRSIYQRIGSRQGQSTKSYSPRSQGSIPRTQGSGPLAVRSVPAWVKHGDDEDANEPKPRPQSQSQSVPLLLPPGDARIANHHYSTKGKDGRLDDDSGEGEDARYRYTQESRWRTFTRSAAHTQVTAEEGRIVDSDWLNQNFGDYSGPWQGYIDEKDTESGRQSGTFIQRRKRWVKGFQYRILHSPMVPLIIRLT
ncbi:hypothetical protein FQN49_007768, partial [Arthroderma sp. PD_2]